MTMERRRVAALPWHLGRETVAETALAEAYRWELVGVHSEAGRWKRLARMLRANDQEWFAQAAAAAALSGEGAGSESVALAEDRAALLRGLIYFRSLNQSHQSA